MYTINNTQLGQKGLSVKCSLKSKMHSQHNILYLNKYYVPTSNFNKYVLSNEYQLHFK